MHAGLIIYGTLDTVSGGYLYDRKLVEHLRRCGDQVEIISLPWRSYANRLLDNFSLQLYRQMLGFKGDLLLQDELNHPSVCWLNRRIKPRTSYQVLSIVHHLRCQESRPAWQNLLYRSIERFYLQTIEGFIVNSNTTLQTIQQTGIDVQRLPHIVARPAGDQFKPDLQAEEIVSRAKLPGPLRVIFIGNLIPRKGLHTLLEAISRMPALSCTLAVVGNQAADPVYTKNIHRLMEKLRVKERVELHGLMDPASLSELLRASQVLVVPSVYEGYGIVYLEGMSFGLPAIGTSAGGAGEIITDGLDGFLIPPEDSETLMRCLEKLSADRARLAELGLAARRRYEAQPTWTETGAQIREFLVSQTADRRNRDQ